MPYPYPAYSNAWSNPPCVRCGHPEHEHGPTLCVLTDHTPTEDTEYTILPGCCLVDACTCMQYDVP